MASKDSQESCVAGESGPARDDEVRSRRGSQERDHLWPGRPRCRFRSLPIFWEFSEAEARYD